MPFLTRARSLKTLLVGLLVLTAITSTNAPAQATPTDGSPFGSIDGILPTATGVVVGGWVIDPDTTSPVTLIFAVDGHSLIATSAASPRADIGQAYPQSGPDHAFNVALPLNPGWHTICIGTANQGRGVNTVLGCRRAGRAVNPIGSVDVAAQTLTGLRIAGWALDADTLSPISVSVTENGKVVQSSVANKARSDVAALYSVAPAHGFEFLIPIAAVGPRTFCVTATNVGGGAAATLGCRTINWAGNPVGTMDPIALRTSSSTISVTGWAYDPQTNDPITVIYALDGKSLGTVSADEPAAGLTPIGGIDGNHGFSFQIPSDTQAHTVCIGANNVGIGVNVGLGCQVVPKMLPPTPGVTTPALISTSRYIRNIHGTAGDVAITRAMGAADAAANPANHRYLSLLQIGGQTTTGIILSATSTYVTYAQAVTALEGYIDGYASRQQYNAAVILAIGTNNDIDVRALTGAIWATQVINPLRVYASRYPTITIAGANDIEPGFIGTMTESQQWVSGYLGSTSAQFVFNGSADGCAWTIANGMCNNGWTMAGLGWMAGAAINGRILDLPQIYNNTMPQQWKYISLTNIVTGKPRINFAGPLTEWTACYTQSGGCGSLDNNSAWSALWHQINSDGRTAQASLPYGTDLRIN